MPSYQEIVECLTEAGYPDHEAEAIACTLCQAYEDGDFCGITYPDDDESEET